MLLVQWQLVPHCGVSAAKLDPQAVSDLHSAGAVDRLAVPCVTADANRLQRLPAVLFWRSRRCARFCDLSLTPSSRPSARGWNLGRSAVGAVKRKITLDTAVEDGASKLYERVGFTLAGVIRTMR
jgi:hypothetical protein